MKSFWTALFAVLVTSVFIADTAHGYTLGKGSDYKLSIYPAGVAAPTDKTIKKYQLAAGQSPAVKDVYVSMAMENAVVQTGKISLSTDARIIFDRFCEKDEDGYHDCLFGANEFKKVQIKLVDGPDDVTFEALDSVGGILASAPAELLADGQVSATLVLSAASTDLSIVANKAVDICEIQAECYQKPFTQLPYIEHDYMEIRSTETKLPDWCADFPNHVRYTWPEAMGKDLPVVNADRSIYMPYNVSPSTYQVSVSMACYWPYTDYDGKVTIKVNDAADREIGKVQPVVANLGEYPALALPWYEGPGLPTFKISGTQGIIEIDAATGDITPSQLKKTGKTEVTCTLPISGGYYSANIKIPVTITDAAGPLANAIAPAYVNMHCGATIRVDRGNAYAGSLASLQYDIATLAAEQYAVDAYDDHLDIRVDAPGVYALAVSNQDGNTAYRRLTVFPAVGVSSIGGHAHADGDAHIVQEGSQVQLAAGCDENGFSWTMHNDFNTGRSFQPQGDMRYDYAVSYCGSQLYALNQTYYILLEPLEPDYDEETLTFSCSDNSTIHYKIESGPRQKARYAAADDEDNWADAGTNEFSVSPSLVDPANGGTVYVKAVRSEDLKPGYYPASQSVSRYITAQQVSEIPLIETSTRPRTVYYTIDGVEIARPAHKGITVERCGNQAKLIKADK